MCLTPYQFIEMLRNVEAEIEAASAWLCELDGQIADGDHGVSMAIGMRAVSVTLGDLDPSSDLATICSAAAQAFLSAVGATAGPLYATALMRAGAAVKGRAVLDAGGMVAWISAAAHGIQDRGKADLGDKTMLDAWLPAAAAAERRLKQGGDLPGCLAAAASAAEQGAKATRELLPVRGRASRLGVRAVGHVDPGAASAAVILRAMACFAASVPVCPD
jgi:dihydroxyacetone kinase phosphoprotein-dependent L subunit